MDHRPARLAPGLYFVATPIGTARDITLRALDVLASADVLAAEDTRTLRKLMEIHAVPAGDRPIIAYHEHNGPKVRPRLLAMLAEGKSVAYASEAGTPLVSDPGFVLAREAIAAGADVTAAPGPSAVMAALTVAGLPTDRFFFAGFAPAAQGARRSYLESLVAVPGTLVFFESPKRVGKLLTDMAEVLGGTRQAAVCRELTKKFEETRRGTLQALAAQYAGTPPRGEVVVLVDRAGAEAAASDDEIAAALRDHMAEGSLKDAVAAVSAAYGRPRKAVYQMALALAKGD